MCASLSTWYNMLFYCSWSSSYADMPTVGTFVGLHARPWTDWGYAEPFTTNCDALCTLYSYSAWTFLKFELQEPACWISTKANRCHPWPFCEFTIVPFLTHVLIDADHSKPAPEVLEKLQPGLQASPWSNSLNSLLFLSFPFSNSSTGQNIHLLLYFTGAMMKTCI